MVLLRRGPWVRVPGGSPPNQHVTHPPSPSIPQIVRELCVFSKTCTFECLLGHLAKSRDVGGLFPEKKGEMRRSLPMTSVGYGIRWDEYSYLFLRRRMNSAAPTPPRPIASNPRLTGSGTVTGPN